MFNRFPNIIIIPFKLQLVIELSLHYVCVCVYDLFFIVFFFYFYLIDRSIQFLCLVVIAFLNLVLKWSLFHLRLISTLLQLLTIFPLNILITPSFSKCGRTFYIPFNYFKTKPFFNFPLFLFLLWVKIKFP